MTVFDFISKLGAVGVKLWLEGEQLRFKAPKGALTPELKETLIAKKSEVIAFLQGTKAGEESLPIKPIPRGEGLKLSFAQQRLWFIDQLDPGSPSYNIPVALTLKGHLDVEVLRQVFEEIVKRHEAIRTTFLVKDDATYQVIQEPYSWHLSIFRDLSELEEDNRQKALIDLARDEADRGFDLTDGTQSRYRRTRLMRTRLIRMTAHDDPWKEEHVLFITMHHIISDGWSVGVLIDEVTRLYDAFKNGKPSPLLPLTIQYADYAQWQRDWLTGAVLEHKMEYWRQQLEGVPVLELPTDKPRPPVQTFAGSSIDYSLPEDLVAKLNQLSLDRGVTLFMVLTTAFKILLRRYSGQDDICVGTPIANRGRSELEPLIGFFVNTLTLRSDLSGNPTFTELLSAVQDTTLGAYSHQDVPFEKLVEEFSGDRNMSFGSLVQAVITLQNTPMEYDLDLSGLRVERVPMENATSKFDLSVSFTEMDNKLVGGVEYNTDLFHESTMERFIQHFENILAEIADNPELRIDDVKLLSEVEATQQLVDWNTPKTDAFADATLHHTFEKIAADFPDNIALTLGEQQVSYRELNTKANQLAHYLISQNVTVGDLVGLCVERSVDMLVGILGILKAGAAYVPVDPSSPADRIAFIIEDAQVKTIVTQASVADKCSAGNTPTVLLDNVDEIGKASVENPATSVTKNNIAYVIYTSGTTGRPKGVLLPHSNALRLFTATEQWFGFDDKDVWTLFHSYAFDFTVWEIWGALLHGGRLVIVPYETTRSPNEFYQLLLSEKVTVLNQTPSAFTQLIHIDENHVAAKDVDTQMALRYVIFGGEALDFMALRSWVDRRGLDQPQLINMYGITETTVHVTYHRITEADLQGRASIIGVPIPDLSLYILDEKLALLPIGVVGELHVGGAGLAQGYLNREELTAERFIYHSIEDAGEQRLYKTGDLGKFLPDGSVEYLGRIDDQVKIRGFRIELGEIESCISAADGVRESVVVVREDKQDDKRIAAYMVAEPETDINVGRVKNYLKAQLPEYMVPSSFVVLESLPLTSNGKVDKKALPVPESTAIVGAVYVEPASEIEYDIAEAFSDILRVPKVGADDGFFELGGHSLLATQLVSRIRSSYHVELPLKDFFDAPTVSGVSKTIVRLKENASSVLVAPRIVPVVRNPSGMPISFAQQRLAIIDQFEPNNAAYNMPFALRITGEINAALFARVFEEVVARHETLRTVFHNVGGETIQIIKEPSGWQLDVEDISVDEQGSGRTSDEVEKVARVMIKAEASIPFDLATGPLFRTRLLKTGVQSHILMVTMHHIISDGWSIGVMVDEITSLYEAFEVGGTSPLLPLVVQYADFAQWQREWLQGDVLQQYLDYWVNELSGAQDFLRLPTDRPRPSVQTFNGAIFSYEFDDDLYKGIRYFSQDQGVTVFTTMMAAYAVLLAKYASQDDICIGTPVAGRNRGEIENLIGYFINAVAIRCRLEGNPSLSELVQRIHQASMGAFSHQDVPIEKILDELNLARSMSHPPLVQVGFSFQNVARQPLKTLGHGITTELIDNDQVTAKYDMTFDALETDEGMSGNVEYNVDLFDESTIQEMVEHYQAILRQIVDNADCPLNNLSVVGKDELVAHYNKQNGVAGEKDKYENIYPLTPVQRDVYLSAKIEPDTITNSFGYRLDLSFSLDLELWKKSLQHSTESHDLLRAEFVESTVPYLDIAYLAIKKQSEFDFALLDVCDRNLSEDELWLFCEDLVVQPYNLREDALIRYYIVKVSDSRSIFVAAAHHGLMDGLGLSIHAKQIVDNYAALKHGDALTDISNDYMRYVESERNIADTLEIRRFWQKRLVNVEPLDFSMPGKGMQDVGQGASTNEVGNLVIRQLVIGDDHFDGLVKFCRKNRVTPAIYLKAVYGLLINLYCRGENDFAISEFDVGRSKDDFESLGVFYQQFPFVFPRSLMGGESTISDLLKYTRQYQKEIKGQQHISIMEQRRMAPIGRLGFMFNFYQFAPDLLLGDEKVPSKEFTPVVEDFVRMIAQVRKDDGKLQVELHYYDHLFDDIGFMQRFESLSEQIIAGVEKVEELSFLSDVERQRQLVEWNDSYVPLPEISSLQQMFDAQVEKTPDNIAVSCGENSLTYSELHKRSNQLAHYLRHRGVGPDVHVGICMERSIELMIALLGVVKSGGIYIPMDAAYPRERLGFMLDDSDATLLLTQRCLLDRLPSHGGQTVSIDASEEAEAIKAFPESNPDNHNNLNDAFYIIYTSGSTGQPKGATVTHRGEINLIQWYINEYQFTENDRHLVISAFGFDLTQKNLFGAVISGGRVVFPEMDYFDSHRIAEIICEEEISIVNCAPSAFYSVVEESRDLANLSSLRALILGGEALRVENLEPWIRSDGFNCGIHNNYGPSECSDISASYTLEDPLSYINRSVPIGRPSDNVQLYVLSDSNQVLPIGVTGELCVAGAGMGLGYLNKKALTEEKFQANPFYIEPNDVSSPTTSKKLYRTGDLARYLPDGSLEFIGRKDFQVKLRGLRIELGEIEYALRQQETVTDALVIVHNDKLVAYVTTHDTSLDRNLLREDLSHYLPNFMVPSLYVALEHWPLTPNGKIDRKALPDPDDVSNREVEFVPPRDDIEGNLAAIWCDVLGLEQVGVYDDFFDLGGHSLTASRAVGQFMEKFEVEIPLKVLFEMTTIDKIASYIRATSMATEAPPVEDDDDRDEGFL